MTGAGEPAGPISQHNRPMTGKDIRSLRTARGWTQQELGDELGIHQNTVARLERGELPITRRMAQTIALVSQVAAMRATLDR